MTAKKRWHVEFDVEQWIDPHNGTRAEWHADYKLDPSYNQLEMDSYYIQIPLDATITELAPEFEEGYYANPVGGGLFRRKDGRWGIWNADRGDGYAWTVAGFVGQFVDCQPSKFLFLGSIQEGDR